MNKNRAPVVQRAKPLPALGVQGAKPHPGGPGETNGKPGASQASFVKAKAPQSGATPQSGARGPPGLHQKTSLGRQVG